MATWLEVCDAFARRSGVRADFVEALRAFDHPNPRGGPPAPPEMAWNGDFEALERACREDADVAHNLSLEVDSEQAAMFGRRLRAVNAMLLRQGDATARMLRVGLWHRLQGILAAPRPRALRVRALADFYYSYAGRHHHERTHAGRDLPATRTLIDATPWTTIVPGVELRRVDGIAIEGPVHVNVVRAQRGSVRLEVVDCRDEPKTFAELARDAGAVAAVSGGFFLYSEPDIEPPSKRGDPVGLLVRNGEVLSPPTFPRGALVQADEIRIERVGLGGVFTRADGMVGPDEESIAVVGRTVTAVGRRLPVPLNGFVRPGAGSVGQRVDFDLRIEHGIAGGPRIVHGGRVDIDLRAEGFWGSAPPVTFSQDETGDHNLLPRLAAGIDADGALVLAAFDGRNFDRALGFTLGGVAEVMLHLGCVEATNLDGGASKRIVVQGRTLDVASTEIRVGDGPAQPQVRRVHTGVLLHAL